MKLGSSADEVIISTARYERSSRTEPGRRRMLILLALFGYTVGWAVSAGAEGRTGQSRDKIMGRVEAARHRGDIVALEKLRTELEIQFETLLEDSESRRAELRYDLAYLLWRSHLILSDAKKRTPEQKKIPIAARAQINALLKLEPEHLEGKILESSIYAMQAQESFIARLRYGRPALEIAQASIDRAPLNPRARLQWGIMLLHMPAVLGGGGEPAIEQFELARQAFESQPPDSGWPNWGATETLAFMGQALAGMGRTEEARSVYEQALAREPYSGWIRDELLPALDP